ncbi:MAG: TfoX/Sxy family protein [Actinomycetota bacterium]|nr:TfoX/Sxy family protein [Actinomycetota bacterium]
MPYDDGLVERVRAVLASRADITERKLFGSLGFMLAGNMAVAVREDELIVRLDEADAQPAIDEPGVSAFAPMGNPMKGWILVSPEAIADDDDLAAWIDEGTEFAGSLPPK